MSKLFASIESDKGGRVAHKGGNEWLDIDIRVGNAYLARLTVREFGDGDQSGWALFNEEDERLVTLCDGARKITRNYLIDDSGKNGVCVACKGKNPEGCTYC